MLGRVAEPKQVAAAVPVRARGKRHSDGNDGQRLRHPFRNAKIVYRKDRFMLISESKRYYYRSAPTLLLVQCTLADNIMNVLS